MEANIKAKLVQLNIIVTVAHRYFNLLDRYLVGTNITEHGRLVTSLARADELLNILSTGFGKPIYNISIGDIESINAVYTNLAELENLTNEFTIMCESKSYARLLAQELSTGKHADMQLELAKFKTAREQFISIGDGPLVQALANINADSARSFYKYIVDNANASNATKLILEICRKLLTVLTGAQRENIVKFVREQQNSVLGAQIINTKSLPGHAGTIYRCGLVPGTKLLPLADLFAALSWEYDSNVNADANFRVAMETTRHILVLDNSTPTVVQIDFTGVLDLSKVTRVAEFSGLTKAYINRYNVLEQFDTVRKNSDAATLYSVHNEPRHHSNENWYVIERNGNLYRLLVAAGSKPLSAIPAKYIMSLLDGVPDNDSRYSQILAEHSVKVNRQDMFDPRAKIFIDQFRSAQVVKTASGPIKDKILEALQAYTSTLLANIHTAADFIQLFASSAFLQVVNKICADVLSSADKLLARFDTPEYLVSHLSKISSIADKFTKAIKRFASEERIQDRIFREYSADRVIAELTARSVSILTKAANHLDDNGSSWTSGELSLKEFVITGIF
jgi:hypothetical protein